MIADDVIYLDVFKIDFVHDVLLFCVSFRLSVL